MRPKQKLWVSCKRNEARAIKREGEKLLMSCELNPNKQNEGTSCAACNSKPRITLSAVLKLVGVMTVVLFIFDKLSPR